MARRRKNATFTLDQTYGSGHGDRRLIETFYERLNELIPGVTPVPIPPESRVHPKHDTETQLFIFVDYAVRKIAPLAFQGADLDVQAAKLTALAPVVDRETANRAAAEAAAANRAAFAVAFAATNADYADYGDYGDFYASDYAAKAANAAEAAAEYIGYNGNTDYAAAEAATAVYYAAALNPDATWTAVNEMLQAL